MCAYNVRVYTLYFSFFRMLLTCVQYTHGVYDVMLYT